MTLLPAPITPTTARDRLEDDGLASLGLVMPMLGASWSDAAVTFDDAALTLTMTGAVRAPVLAIRSWVTDLAAHGIAGVDGLPFTEAGALVRLHPQAAMRLERLVQGRLPGAAGLIRPIPVAMAIRGASGTTTPQWFAPSTQIVAADGSNRTVSFHDERGLIIDPVAVAALFSDLLTELPGLGSAAPAGGPGGLATIAADGTAGLIVHVVDPHGAAFRAVDGVTPHLMTGATDDGAVPASGLVQLAAGQTIAVPELAAARLRIGWGRNDTLDRVALTPPALPGGVTLHRQFLRVTAVDLDWHLLGNRSDTGHHGISPADQTIPAEFRPRVRDRVRLDYHVDGVAALGAANEVYSALTQPAFNGFIFLASPTLEPDVGLPPSPGPTGHWPTFPAPPGGMPGAAPSGVSAASVNAVWSGDRDVVVTFDAGSLPLGAHVRVYPQVFQLITAITADQPSFLRGDGAAALVGDANAVSLQLADPLRLPDGVIQPAGSTLTFDVVIVERSGTTTMRGNIAVPITAGAPPAVTDSFGVGPGGIDVVTLVPANVQALAPSPLFGVPSTLPPGPTGSLLELLRSLASETTPRTGPRLPTMARFPTLAVVGTRDDSDPANITHDWDALVGGGRWGRETRCADPAAGNPGGPGGPDLHSAGVRVDGRAGFDVAQIALRRARPLVPIGSIAEGWIPFVGGAEWVEPAEPGDDSAPSGQAGRTSAAAVLRTVPVGVETPEASLPGVPIPAADDGVQDIIDSIFPSMPVTFDLAREEQIVREIRREFHWSKFGSRDAQWALRRAIGQARDLVFVSSPQFAATAYPDGGADPHEVDLVAELAARMTAQPSLLVVVCTPRWPDFHELYGGWVRHAFAARNAALQALTDVDADRVVAFHPRGFPGRSAAIRSTSVIVDDVWALVGTSHWRRRGMTFDEGVDVVGFDRSLDGGGASSRIRTYRRALMAALSGVAANEPEFVRLFGTRTCATVVRDLVSQGGLGRLAPFWPGPTDTDVLPQTTAVADPDGGDTDDYIALFAGLINESPP